MERGYVQIYTGNGKGKTTAAIGLSVRAAGSNLKVSFIQFVKGRYTSEMKSLEKLGIEFFQGGRPEFIIGKPAEEDINAANKTLEMAKERTSGGKYDLVVLDEINIAIYLKLLKEEEVIDLVLKRSPQTELVLTGRYAPQKLIEIADLVTEMCEIKHYYTKGVAQRIGIEL